MSEIKLLLAVFLRANLPAALWRVRRCRAAADCLVAALLLLQRREWCAVAGASLACVIRLLRAIQVDVSPVSMAQFARPNEHEWRNLQRRADDNGSAVAR